MTKFTKISAAALLALFLTACDKPANKAPEAAAQDKPAAAQAAQAAPEAKQETGEQDYKAFRDWQAAQEKAINEAVNKVLTELGDKANDPKVASAAVNKALLAEMDKIKQSAAALSFKDATVNALKEKSLEVIDLGAKMITASENVANNPNDETHKAFGELQAQLDKVVQEGQAIEAELVKKYEPAPAPAPQAEKPAEQAPAAPAEKPAQ